tara:strand:+ start:11080 stop:11436 length:357 start_codon:yes stop_codon:yes gene_type:complete
MAIASLTFSQPIQVSVQAGDLILYCPTSNTAGFNTAAQSDVVALGTCLTVATDRLSMTVEHDANTSLPSADDFILFSKDKHSHASGLLGYYAEVCFKNNSTAEAELFGINADMFQSSK